MFKQNIETERLKQVTFCPNEIDIINVYIDNIGTISPSWFNYAQSFGNLVYTREKRCVK